MMWDSGNKYYGRLAMPYSDRQMELTPDSAFYTRRRGWLLQDMGEYEEALKAFERSLELEESQFAYNGMGKTLNNLRRHEEALDCLRKAIELGAAARIQACTGKAATACAVWADTPRLGSGCCGE